MEGKWHVQCKVLAQGEHLWPAVTSPCPGNDIFYALRAKMGPDNSHHIKPFKPPIRARVLIPIYTKDAEGRKSKVSTVLFLLWQTPDSDFGLPCFFFSFQFFVTIHVLFASIGQSVRERWKQGGKLGTRLKLGWSHHSVSTAETP